METYNQLEKLVASMKADVTKCYTKGNNTAGIRVRKALQEVKILAQQIRKEISQNRED